MVRTTPVMLVAGLPPKIPTVITDFGWGTATEFPATSVEVGKSAYVAGYLKRADTLAYIGGKPVTVTVTKPDATVQKFSLTTGTANGRIYTGIITIDQTGTWTAVIEFAGDATYEGCEEKSSPYMNAEQAAEEYVRVVLERGQVAFALHSRF